VADPGRVHVELPDELPATLADTGLAERVVANLLDNALRHSPPGLMVTVTGRVRGDLVVCDVVDHGPGIPHQLHDQVFAPFQRLGDRRSGGVGLGLAVARGLSEAMGGTLVPHTTQGGGLTMRLALPAAPTP
jgi:two-component system sensor histidine kinase KdpD